MYRGADGLDARRNLINRQIADAGGFNISTDADRVARKALNKGLPYQRKLDFDTPSGAQGKPPKVTKMGKLGNILKKVKKSRYGKAAKLVSKVPFLGDIALAGTALYGISQYNKMNKSTPGSSGSGTTNKKPTELKLDNPNDVTRTPLVDKKGRKIRVPLGTTDNTIKNLRTNINK